MCQQQPGGYVTQEILPGTHLTVPVSRDFVGGYIAGSLIAGMFGIVRQVVRDGIEARRIRRCRAR